MRAGGAGGARAVAAGAAPGAESDDRGADRALRGGGLRGGREEGPARGDRAAHQSAGEKDARATQLAGRKGWRPLVPTTSQERSYHTV